MLECKVCSRVVERSKRDGSAPPYGWLVLECPQDMLERRRISDRAERGDGGLATKRILVSGRYLANRVDGGARAVGTSCAAVLGLASRDHLSESPGGGLCDQWLGVTEQRDEQSK